MTRRCGIAQVWLCLFMLGAGPLWSCAPARVEGQLLSTRAAWSALTTDPAVTAGAAWLAARIQPDGSLSGEAGSIALPAQQRAEALHALALAAPPANPALVAAIAATNDADLEWLARQSAALAAADGVAPAFLARIAQGQNADGGFGARRGDASNALDTALALIALAANPALDAAVPSRALSYLKRSLDASGAAGVTGEKRVYVTAYVVLGADAWRSRFDVSAIAQPATAWLLSQRQSGAFSGPLENAVALLAVATQTNDAAVLGPISGAVRAGQGASGSWGDDAFVTALSTRALWRLTVQPAPPTTGVIAGSVASAASGAAISGATLQLAERAEPTGASGADGAFNLAAVPPGSYTLRASAVGFATAQLPVSVQAGQIVQVGRLSLPVLPLAATLSGVVRTSGGSPIQDALVAVGTASVTASSQGAYQLADLSPGPATITVSKSGYVTVTATVTFEAGRGYTFSPALYPSSGPQPPADASLKGRVLDQGTGAAIAGATVTAAGKTATTGSDGRFLLSGLATGAFELAISATNFAAVRGSGLLSAGANDAGDVKLARLPTSSTLGGTVTNIETGAPVAGATVTVAGAGLSSTSDAAGQYRIAGIANTAFHLLVTAAGYADAGFDVSLPQRGEATVNLRIAPATSGQSGVVFREIRTTQAEYGPYEEFEVEVEVQNTTTAAASLVVEARVTDEQDRVAFELKANAQGLGQNPPNLPVPIPAGAIVELEMMRVLLRQPAGRYTVLVRGLDASGRVAAQGTTQFSVRAEPLLAGGLVIDPPMVQAGTGTPVTFRADLTNLGNQSVPAGDYELKVTVSAADDQTSTQPVTDLLMVASGAPFSNPWGATSDEAGNVYVANEGGQVVRLTPAGAREVVASVPNILLGDVARASDGTLYASQLKGTHIYRFDPAGTRSDLLLTSVSNIRGMALAPEGDLIVAGEAPSSNGTITRLVRRTPAGVETVISTSGLTDPASMVRDGDGSIIVANQRDNTLSRLLPTGAVVPFLAGLDRPYGLVRDGAGNLFVANAGSNTIERITPAGSRQTWATGLNQPGDLAIGPDGALFATNRGDHSILRIPSAGTVEVFANSLANGPQGMALDAAGNLFIANDDGTLRRKAPDGAVTVAGRGLLSPRGVLVDGDAVLVANRGDGTVRRISGGTTSTFATGLTTPHSLARSGTGELHVTEESANRISRLDASGAVVERIESPLLLPSKLRVGPGGRLFVLNNNFVTVREGGVARTHLRGFNFGDIAPDASGGYAAHTGPSVYRVSAAGVATLARSVPFGLSGVAIGPGGDILLADRNAKQIQRLNASNVLSVYATLADYPDELVSDGAGTVFARTASGRLLKIAAGGTVTELANLTGLGFYQLGMAADGRLLAFNSNVRRVVAIHPETGAQVELLNGLVSCHGLALSAAGVLTIANQYEYELYDYTAGVRTGVLSGFSSPLGIVWTGSELRFVAAQGLFSVVPGANPVKLGAFPANYLVMRDGALIGSGTSLLRWTGPSYTTFSPVPGSSTYRGLAAGADGVLWSAVGQDSRVAKLDNRDALVAQYGGLVAPLGLAFDAAGDLHVANGAPGTIVRYRRGKVAPELAARNLADVRHLAFNAAGQILLTRGGSLNRLDLATGVETGLASDSAASLRGLLIDGDRTLVVDGAKNQIRRLNGSALDVVATGLYEVAAVRLDGQGAIYVAGHDNGTVARYANGQLGVYASGLVGPRALVVRGDGSVVVAGDSGAAYSIASAGNVNAIDVGALVGRRTFTGAAVRGSGVLLLDQLDKLGTAYQLTITQPVPPPAPGTVVFQAARSAPELAVGEGRLDLDFGSWKPAFGGDFKAEVRRAGVSGSAANFLHAGPHATASLTALTATVPPGDRAVPLRLSLIGADFTSVSRVETGRFRKLVSIGFPNGMTADKAGNLFFTNASTLFKVAPDGTSTPVAEGLSTRFGLASDSAENLYLPNFAAGRYQLLRVAPGGGRTVVSDLGTSQVNGVAVDSRDRPLVARTSALLRVDPADGGTTTVSTVGLPSPLGVAVDGRDNMYVQNQDQSLAQILPDGHTRVIFSTSTPGSPGFEGDGYPTITADCADNFYVTASTWPRISQSGEEHILAQVVPRTGQVVGLLDVTKVNPSVGDIDYLSFDRFGNRLLLWDHNTSAIYQVPVTCGAIGVEVHLVTLPGQALTGFDRAPALSVPLPDGRIEHVWRMSDVTAQGMTLAFDAPLRALALGERRAVIDSGFIAFKNTFVQGEVRLPIAIPTVEAVNAIDLIVTTDQPEYSAGETALVSAALHNGNDAELAGDLELTVLDAAGASAGQVLARSVTLPPGGDLPASGPFAIGNLAPGAYTARAVVVRGGLTLARASTTFRVLASNAAATATSRVQLDRSRYGPSDRVRITSSAVSQSANVTLANLLLTAQVLDPAGALLGTYYQPVDQLLPGATRSFTAAHPLVSAGPGRYRVAQTLTDAQGRLYDARSVDFEVMSSADTGAGLTGALSAQPASGEAGVTIQLDAKARNGGNSDLPDVPLKIAVLDLLNGEVVWSAGTRKSIARGTEVAFTERWTTTGARAGEYTAALIATIGGREVTLARADVQLTARAYAVDATQEISAGTRLLALVTSAPGQDEQARTQSLHAYLQGLRVAHRIVTDPNEFEMEALSGRYNAYWLSGGRDRLSQRAAQELREAIFRGEGLVVEGLHDQRNHLLDEPMGVKYRGKLPHPDQAVTMPAGVLFPAAELVGRGTALKVEPAGAVTHGVFAGAPANPAVLTSAYGLGRAATFAFDLLATLMAEPQAVSLRAVVQRTLQHVTPPLRSEWHARELVPLVIEVTNRGAPLDLEVALSVPAGATVEGPEPPGLTVTAQGVTWRAPLAQGERKRFIVGLRLGDGGGAVEVTTRISAVKGTSSQVLATLRTPLTWTGATAFRGQVLQRIRSLAPSPPNERNARDQAAASVTSAIQAMDRGDYDGPRTDLLKARDRLVAISSVNITGARVAIAELARIDGVLLYTATNGAEHHVP